MNNFIRNEIVNNINNLSLLITLNKIKRGNVFCFLLFKLFNKYIYLQLNEAMMLPM